MAPPLRPDAFLITGHPRSGTTLLAEILGRHDEIEVLPETHFFDETRTRRLLGDVARGDLDRTLDALVTGNASLRRIVESAGGVAALRAHCRDHEIATAADLFFAVLDWLKVRKGVRLLGEKTPDHILAAERLARVHPTLKLIDVVRDPRGVALSWRHVGWGEHDAAFVALRWRRAVATAQRVGATLGPRFLQLRYEDLVADPQETLARTCAFLGVAPLATMLDDTATASTYDVRREPWKAQASRSVSGANVDRWRRQLPPADVRAVEIVAGAALDRLGYPLTLSDVGGARRVLERTLFSTRAVATGVCRKIRWSRGAPAGHDHRREEA
jgi:hypothetical protein